MQPAFADLPLPDLRLRSGDTLLPSEGVYALEDPCLAQTFAEIPVAGAAAVDAAVDAAQRALRDPAWRDPP